MFIIITIVNNIIPTPIPNIVRAMMSASFIGYLVLDTLHIRSIGVVLRESSFKVGDSMPPLVLSPLLAL